MDPRPRVAPDEEGRMLLAVAQELGRSSSGWLEVGVRAIHVVDGTFSLISFHPGHYRTPFRCVATCLPNCRLRQEIR